MASKYFRGQYGGVFKVTSGPVPSFLEGAERISRSDFIAERIAQLKHYIAPGDTLYTVLAYVSRDGTSRRIKILAIRDGAPVDLSRYAADVLEWRYNDKDGAVVVSGCGMDMGFHLAYSLSSVVLGDGYAVSHRWI